MTGPWARANARRGALVVVGDVWMSSQETLGRVQWLIPTVLVRLRMCGEATSDGQHPGPHQLVVTCGIIVSAGRDVLVPDLRPGDLRVGEHLQNLAAGEVAERSGLGAVEKTGVVAVTLVGSDERRQVGLA